jgi:hypothetical protein
MPVKSHITDPATGQIAQVSNELDGAHRLKVDAALDNETLACADSGSYPDPGNTDVGQTCIAVDGYGNLRSRSVVLTDEASFRDDFDGTSLSRTLVGTFKFINGRTEVEGTGTLFTSELSTDDHIKLSSHGDVYYARIDTIIDDLHLILAEEYFGLSSTGSAVASSWKMETSVSGLQSVSSSILSLQCAKADGNITGIYREGDYLPFALTWNGKISQRIADQEALFGFEDSFADPSECACFVFTGTDNTKILCRSMGGPDSLQETEVSLAGGLSTDQYLSYEVDITPSTAAFSVNGQVICTHKIHIPKPYTSLSFSAYITNLAAVPSTTTLYIDQVFFQNTDQVQIGAIFQGEPILVQGITDGVPINVQFSVPGGGLALPKMVDLAVDKSEGAIVASVYKNVLSYTVPTGYNCYLIKFTSFQGETAKSRLVTYTYMGTLTINTNVFVAGTAYSAPQWTSLVQADVTTQLSSGSGSVTVTVTYTNELGVGSRTGTITIPKGSLVGARFDLVLQSGDLGLRSIENLSVSPTLAAGAIRIIGLINLSTHQDQSTTTQTETTFAPGAVTMPTGTIIAMEYAGGLVSKTRNLDTLVQLIAASV